MSEEILAIEAASTNDKGQRLDKYLAVKMNDMSRSAVQRLILDGNVSLDDDIIIDNSYKVKEGDEFFVYIPEAIEAEPTPEDIELDVVYEDDDLIVVNKPAGMVVHEGAGVHSGTLVNALLHYCQGKLSGIGGVKRPGIVHRIDKDTSGLIVVAKNDVTHRGLSEQFAEHTVERTYFAIVYNSPNPSKGRIEGNIGRSSSDRKKMAIVNKGGKSAATNYVTMKKFGTCAALVMCNLETGRTHQIRVHMGSLGNPLVGDQTYEYKHKNNIKVDAEIKGCVVGFPRQALHAASLGFVHPKSKMLMSFVADFPDDFKELIRTLEKI